MSVLPPQAPEVLVFDLFGVVIAFDNDLVYRRLARYCADPDTAFQRLAGLMASRDVITGRSTLRDVSRKLKRDLGYTGSDADFERAWLEPYSEPMPGMAELLGKLSTTHRLVLLSNVDRYYFDVVRALHPELGCFEQCLLSCDLGLAKPDPEIFQAVSRLTGVSAERCWFTDDTRANIDAAASLGFRTHHFRSVDALARELAAWPASNIRRRM